VLTRRTFLVVFFAYVLLDLCCPLVPGAFSFDPAESVEAVAAYRARATALPRAAFLPPPVTSTLCPTETAAQGAEPTIGPSVERPRHPSRDNLHASDLRPPTEDD
jgi:hypothetical protein